LRSSANYAKAPRPNRWRPSKKQKSPFFLRIGLILCKRLGRIKITPITPAYRQALNLTWYRAGRLTLSPAYRRKAQEERDGKGY